MTAECQCATPGFCPRFNRTMHGRIWEKCRADAAFRALFDHKYLGLPIPPAPEGGPSIEGPKSDGGCCGGSTGATLH
jgi:hypothetical protein